MRLNIEKLTPFLDGHSLEAETGLSKRTLDWCLSGKECSVDAVEIIAAAVGVSVKDISLVDYDEGTNENVIEFMRNVERATATFCQGRYISRVRKLVAERPEACEIVTENPDGTIVARFPVSWIKIKPDLDLTDEEREARAERGRQAAQKYFKHG